MTIFGPVWGRDIEYLFKQLKYYLCFSTQNIYIHKWDGGRGDRGFEGRGSHGIVGKKGEAYAWKKTKEKGMSG